ncbi:hypothetical protein [Variovorax sp. JS1663]|uniref:hypothetical protein n=1 Tax=Variovorax sp. JS1663 TaxID=1851577 RepID=UPI00117D526E|nr:hypothetical protein [Variovorax sp. JS1663]
MTTSRKKRSRAPRPSLRSSPDQAELSALVQQPEPAAPPPAASAPVAPSLASPRSPASPADTVQVEPGPATFSIDEISTAVHYWGEDARDKSAAKVSGGFGPNACLVIEVLTLMSVVNRERAVACKPGSNLARVVNEALQARPSLQPTDRPAHAVA